MTSNHIRAGAFLAAAIILSSTIGAPVAEAQSRTSSYSQWREYYQRSSEGESDEQAEQSATSRSSVSSAARRAISKLDDDPVEEMPIPILMGFSLAQLSKNFGDPRDGGARSHEGLDIMAATRSYIVSPTDAVVTRVGSGSSSGKYVYTANPGEETFAYMHLDEIADGLKSGTVLKKGDFIGYVGNTGNASGGPAHLHFEIREGRKATDPFPRLTEEFTLKERIATVEEILKDADDEEEEAELMVARYRSTFVSAAAQGIELPEEISDALGFSTNMPILSGYTRDLTLGSTGDDVIALQTFLISKNLGVKAKALAAAGATGYFGGVTQAALAEYQTSVGITPAAGYFGALTRARVTSGS